MADIVIEKVFKQPHFTWGAGNITDNGEARKAYLKAVKAADTCDFEPLMAFVRSSGQKDER